ncbi:MAG TPA: CopD family protein [Conexibacter sp.]
MPPRPRRANRIGQHRRLARRVLRVCALASAGLVALACLVPAAASAHAELESTSPQRGAVLQHAPAQVVFTFGEPVEGNFGSVRVFDSNGTRVDEGQPYHPGGNSHAMAVRVRQGIPHGTYTATYRVVSADSHIVSSGVVFSVGHAGAAGRTVGQLLSAGNESGPLPGTVLGVARGVQYAAIALVLGALAFALLVWRRALPAALRDGSAQALASAAFSRRLRLLVVGGALVGALDAAVGIWMQAATAAGLSPGDALQGSVLRETLQTRFGTVWGIGLLLWLAVAALGAAALRRERRRLPLLAPGLAALPFLLLPALAGHGSSEHPVGVLFPANVLHVTAVTVWVGGIVVLLFALPAATRALPERSDRTRLLAGALERFSPLALGAVALLLVSGIVQSLELLHLPGELFSTGYGRAVLIKVLIVLSLIGVGAYQRRRSLPRLRNAVSAGETPGGTGVLLRRALRAELLLMAGALVATAVLASSAPGNESEAGPFDETTAIGPLEMELTIDPASVGSNTLHLYLINARDGSQFRGAKQVVLEATQPSRGIGPLRETPDLAGPGHYTLASMPFGTPGEWELRVTVRVSAFDEYDKTIEVPIT